jgi:MFS superfamily sulfate permease-like transporter
MSMQRIDSNGLSRLGWRERALFALTVAVVVSLGLTLGVVAIGIGVLVGSVLAVRIAWARHKLRRRARSAHPHAVIDGEFRVIDERGGSHG